MNCLKETSVLLCILLTVFGIGSWVDMNGVFVQLPIVVNHLPEGWTLPVYLSVIIQIGNVGPLIYLALLQFVRSASMRESLEKLVIYFILLVGICACALLALFWHKTTWMLHAERSVALFVLVFCLALVDCTSSLTFLPFVASYSQVYLTALYIGEGCSGLLPGLVALVQGSGGAPMCINGTTNGTEWAQCQRMANTRAIPSSSLFRVRLLLGTLWHALLQFLQFYSHQCFAQFAASPSAAADTHSRKLSQI